MYPYSGRFVDILEVNVRSRVWHKAAKVYLLCKAFMSMTHNLAS